MIRLVARRRGVAAASSTVRWLMTSSTAASRLSVVRMPQLLSSSSMSMRRRWRRTVGVQLRKRVEGTITRRSFARISDLDEAKYETMSHELLDSLLDRLEDDALELPDGSEFDVESSSGVLNVRAGSAGVWVINKHTASKQIWLSSPVSGPARFEFDEDSGAWVNERDHSQRLYDVLTGEFRNVFQDHSFAFDEEF
eukprot:TRINITY_DN18317_c0_g1_i1.p1 TRINITY_DN18317_c0_g1~~TRINITY_DN18317_c0_g1_i1.p1  ORF type:complete len:196 (+),score=79.17 TRINITY_DN18317_c0_g1_i1:27-614(+)